MIASANGLWATPVNRISTFCGEKVNPGFPYCVEHCGLAYQAQMPRRDRKPLPFAVPGAKPSGG